MKTIKLLFFVLICLKLNAQNEEPMPNDFNNFSKPKWDIHLAVGKAEHRNSMIGLQGSINGRFNHHIYASVSYMGATEVSVFFTGLLSPLVNDDISNFSVVTGGHYSSKWFYGALGVGLGSAKGNYWEYSKRSRYTFQTYGFEIKAQTSLVIWKYIGFGLSYQYNINRFKNFQSVMFGWQFGLLR